MSVIRVFALGIGWIVLLAGSLACLGAGAFAVGNSFGSTFGPGWSGALLTGAVGLLLMIGALPMMYFGCEAHRPIKTAGFAPIPDRIPVGVRSRALKIPVSAMSSSARPSSSTRARTLEHPR